MIRIFTSKTQSIGEMGEKMAIDYLQKSGFFVVGRNINNKYGEIDIVAKKAEVYYFFEVKAGKYGSSINPAENLSKNKIGKFLISVDHYCLVNKIQDYRVKGLIVIMKEVSTATFEILDLN